MSSRQRFWARLRALGFSSYDEYLNSEHWADLRRRYFASKLYKGRCYICGRPGPFELHHRTYKRLGAEWLMDLIALCRSCHQQVHTLEKGSPKSLWESSKPRHHAGRQKRLGRHTSPVARRT